MVKRKRKKNSINKKPVYIVIMLIVLVILCVYLYKLVFVTKVDKITVSGNKFITVDEFKKHMFEGESSISTIELFFADKYKDKKVIPYVETYKVNISWPAKVSITVYEKKIMGYVETMGSNMFFDKDGIVVESSKEQLVGIPKVLGIGNDSITLHHKIECDNKDIFSNITKMKQLADKYNIVISQIEFDVDYNAKLYVNDVRVLIGKCEYIEEKMFELSQLYEKIYMLKGELNLKECKGEATNIIFKPD